MSDDEPRLPASVSPRPTEVVTVRLTPACAAYVAATGTEIMIDTRYHGEAP